MLEQIPDLATPAGWLPLAFMAVMGLAILAYVILDGFDLGVGILLHTGDDEQKDAETSHVPYRSRFRRCTLPVTATADPRGLRTR